MLIQLFIFDWYLLFSKLNSKMLFCNSLMKYTTSQLNNKVYKFLLNDFENVHLFSLWLTEQIPYYFAASEQSFHFFFATDGQNREFERDIQNMTLCLDWLHILIINLRQNLCFFPKTHNIFRNWLHKFMINSQQNGISCTFFMTCYQSVQYFFGMIA